MIPRCVVFSSSVCDIALLGVLLPSMALSNAACGNASVLVSRTEGGLSSTSAL